MYNEQIEELISAALADGVLSEKEKQILFKKAQAQGIDLDEFEMVLDARLVELKKAEKEKAEKSAPKSTKYGDVRKCPVCGALVPALAGTCPECGYEFSGIDMNLSSKKLQEKIDDILKEAEAKKSKISNSGKFRDTPQGDENSYNTPLQMALDDVDENARERISATISHFPIPITKNDLFEFITSMQSKCDGSSYYSQEYRHKFEEAYLKAKSLYGEDPIFQPLLKNIDKQTKENKKKILKKKILYTALAIIIPISLIYLEWHFLDWHSFFKVLLILFTVPLPAILFAVLATDDF